MRSFVPFDALWAMPIDVPYSFLVRDGDLAWSCGQLPLDGASKVMAPGDLVRQTEIVCDYIEEILGLGKLSAEAVGKLLLYYVARDEGDRDRMMAVCRARFGERPVLVPIAVPYFYYDGLLLEVDVFASARRGRTVERSSEAGHVRIVDGGELAWASISIVEDRLADGAKLLESALGELDLRLEDRISDHWIALADAARTGTTAEALHAMALLSDEGALIKGGEGRGELLGELTYARGSMEAEKISQGENSDVRVVARRKGRFDWVSARCLDGSLGLVEQTARLMKAIDQTLRASGLDFQAVVKSTSHYVGGSTPEELHDNMAVRNRYYAKPGPASTGLPVFGLADRNSYICVDLLAARPGSD